MRKHSTKTRSAGKQKKQSPWNKNIDNLLAVLESSCVRQRAIAREMNARRILPTSLKNSSARKAKFLMPPEASGAEERPAL